MSHPPRSPKRRPFCSQCGHVLHRHGNRRYRCPACGRSRRLRKRKSGPKRKCRQPSTHVAEFFLQGKFTVRDAATFQGVSYGTAHTWIHRTVSRYVDESEPSRFIWRGTSVVLIADALWLRCGGERWTVYCILARHVGETVAQLIVCQAYCGSESYAGWREAMVSLPSDVRNATIGVTSDGQKGLEGAVRELCPTAAHQRCQFHVLADLRRRLGMRAIAREEETKRCWDLARVILGLDDPLLRLQSYQLLSHSARLPGCPRRTRNAVRWFRHTAEAATVAYGVPDADLPLTTGSAEATCKRLRRLLMQVRPTSPAQLQRALQVFVRLHPSVRCNGNYAVFPLIQRNLR
jgi:transposase-like protein